MIHQLRRIIIMSILSTILAACAGERPDNLGVQGGRLTECPGSPNCVSSQAMDEGHRIAPLVFSDDPASAFASLKQKLGHRGDTTIIEERPCYLRVEFRTTLFVDDGEFLLDGEHRLIHIRSASRLGYSDLGKNRSRLEEIRRQLRETGTNQQL
ncbi:MAG: DUF1499 domain-containing protein [Proteobacteria bacterium]|nr:DUF1499 domain-containing protein [Pseudomonadota bacterium]